MNPDIPVQIRSTFEFEEEDCVEGGGAEVGGMREQRVVQCEKSSFHSVAGIFLSLGRLSLPRNLNLTERVKNRFLKHTLIFCYFLT